MSARSAVWLSLRPTASAMPWSPVVVVGSIGLLVAWLSGTLSDRVTGLPLVVAGAVSAAAVATLRDPADELLRALPTSLLARRLLRTVLASLVVVPVTVGVATLTPGPGAAAATLALVLVGLAASMWMPADRMLAAVSIPACWVAIGLVVDDRLGPLGVLATGWSTHPGLVVVLAIVAVAAGRNR